MAIDRADWHWDSAETSYRIKHRLTGALTDQQVNDIWCLAANHIGLFLRWIIERGLEGEEADEAECELVRTEEMSGAAYLLNDCDGKLWEEDIEESALPFVEAYYNSNQYFICCTNDRDKSLYEVISDEADYQLLKQKIDAAYQKHLSTHQ